MVYVRSRKFCCCLPVRFGVFVMSVAALLGGGLVAIAAWIQIAHLSENPLANNDKISLYIVAAMFTILALVGAFGLIGALARKPNLVSIFGGMLNVHLGLSVLTGAFAIYSLFKQSTDQLNNALAQCISDTALNGSTEEHIVDACKTAINVAKGVVVAAYVVSWLVELYGCFIVHNYVRQLHEEKDAEHMNTPIAAPMGAAYAVPVPSYAFTQPVQSYGNKV
ncbi:hypothetical protein B0H17DRAFT_1101952 [Mycena rosella]|uniref:Tetraspanin n=1 Tax=Mycena rosella TaxID=1033263 RepID=A0AAD7CLG8_MYCRO|nr:hypothetical protein B0H17DRAFT_1101952 [Mycena rosella]